MNWEIFVGFMVFYWKRIIKYICEIVKGKYVYIMVVVIYYIRDVLGMEYYGESLEIFW